MVDARNRKPKPFRKPKPAQQLIQFGPETSTAARSSFFLRGPTPLHSGPKPGQLNPAAHRFLLPSPLARFPFPTHGPLPPFRSNPRSLPIRSQQCGPCHTLVRLTGLAHPSASVVPDRSTARSPRRRLPLQPSA